MLMRCQYLFWGSLEVISLGDWQQLTPAEKAHCRGKELADLGGKSHIAAAASAVSDLWIKGLSSNLASN